MSEPTNTIPWRWQLIIAIALLVLFGAFAVWMVANAGTTDPIWKNQVYVFASVEALVFTAVGWIFGREVNRVGAETARADAANAEAKADGKANEAATAKAGEGKAKQKVADLTAAVDTAAEAAATATAPTTAAGGGGVSGQVSAQSGGAPTVAAIQLNALQLLARRMRDE